MACPQQARLVVVGADEEEQTFAFESLVENDDGMRHPCNCSKILNHLALVLHSYGAAVLGVVTVRLLFGGMQVITCLHGCSLSTMTSSQTVFSQRGSRNCEFTAGI